MQLHIDVMTCQQWCLVMLTAIYTGCFSKAEQVDASDWRLCRMARYQDRLLQLCAVLGSLSGACGMQPAQVDPPARLICYSASPRLPVGVLLGPDLLLPLFPPCQLSAQETLPILPLRRAVTAIFGVLVSNQ